MANFNTRLTKQQIITALTKALESMSEQEVQSAISTAVSGKQDILSFDNTPTSGSSNPVTSGGIHTDQQRQETEIGAVAAQGAKNLLNDKALNATSGTGVTITPNGDGTYALSGTPTGTATYLCTSLGNYTNLLGLETEKSYTITAGSNKVLIRVDYSTNGTSWDNGEDGQPLVSNVAGGASFTIPASAVGLYIRFRSTTSSGSLNGIVLKPMIRRAEITDDTYMPYAPTNRELYEMILSLQSGVSAQSAASLMQAGRIDTELMNNTDNDASEKSGGEEMR